MSCRPLFHVKSRQFYDFTGGSMQIMTISTTFDTFEAVWCGFCISRVQAHSTHSINQRGPNHQMSALRAWTCHDDPFFHSLQ